MSIRARVHHLLNGIVLLSFVFAPLQPLAPSAWAPGDQVRAAPAAGEQALPAVASTNTQPAPESPPAPPAPASPTMPEYTGLYRTTVTLRTPADWRRLEELGVVVLERTAQGITADGQGITTDGQGITTDGQENADQARSQSAASWKSAVILADDAQLEALARSQSAASHKSAVILADDAQLEALARLRFEPRGTDELGALVAAHAQAKPWLAQSLRPLLDQAVALQARVQQSRAAEVPAGDGAEPAVSPEVAAARADLRAAMRRLTSEQQAGLAALTSVDDDGDGLTNTQEAWWCTDPMNPDTDSDGKSDGAEIQVLKDWLANRRSGPPYETPWPDWPPQRAGCDDKDHDSIPNLAERWELGLLMDLETSDRDKFDDGQELFGVTYCPGGDLNCNYGDYPRSSDSGYVGAIMPSWVKAPGSHPLVAAFPVPEIEVVPGEDGKVFHVETVTTVTTDHTISEGTERSYNTAKTEGTSSSVANTETWNEWQEVSESLEEPVGPSASRQRTLHLSENIVAGASADTEVKNCSFFQSLTGQCETISNKELRGIDATSCWGLDHSFQGDIRGGGSLGWDLGPKATLEGSVGFAEGVIKKERSPLDIGCKAYLGRRYQALSPEELEDVKQAINSYNELNGGVGFQRTDPITTVVENKVFVDNSFDVDEIVGGLNGLQYAYLQSGQLLARKLYEIASAIQAPRFTRTETRGKSHGGSQTIEHTTYEEHTVTNGEAFSNSESWGTATAVDSSHAADLWFTYKVRNSGTEYAREIGDLTFNVYIGHDPNPAYTYFVAPHLGGDGKFHNFIPGEEHTYTSRRIPLTLNQMQAIDVDPACAIKKLTGQISADQKCPGGRVRIVVEDFTYGADEFFHNNAAGAGVQIAIEDGTDDGDEAIDTYLIPTWDLPDGTPEKVLDVLARYFPHTTDADGNLIAIWTPEYRSDTPAWCDQPNRVGATLWCRHALSTADWWNIYTNGLGDGSQGFQDTPASPGSVALFRFNKDSDLDGYSDRSERRLGTDPNDPTDHPKPELIAGVHSIRSSNQVTATLSLLNTGLYDAYGVEAVMIAPDDSVSITNNTVGGSGRVRAQKQVVVGSRILLQSPLPAAWTQSGHAVPAAGGYYTGTEDRTYTFTVQCANPGGCDVGAGAWSLAWDDGAGANGTLDFGAGYASPTFLDVGSAGVKLALYTGQVYDA